MGTASPKNPASKVKSYKSQTGRKDLTPAQDRRVRKDDNKNGGK